jgi:hypothetical protein
VVCRGRHCGSRSALFRRRPSCRNRRLATAGRHGPIGTKDLLYGWIQTTAVRKALVLNEKVNAALVQSVINKGYAPNLTDTEAEQLGRDPFLIAYALADVANRTVVTSEVSKPTLTRQNRRVPDVCQMMGAKQCDPFAFNRVLKFSTQWKKKA